MDTENKYQRSIDLLNLATANEIATSLQYMYFHVHCEDMGYSDLARLFKRTSIQEMEHIEDFAERILYLEGDVQMVSEFRYKPLTDVKEMLQFSHRLEQLTVDNYNKYAKETSAMADGITHRMFQDVLEHEEKHLDNFRTELENLERFGDNYLALQSRKNTKKEVEDLKFEDDEL